MLYRFPPSPEEADKASFLSSASEVYAKLKQEMAPGQRTVLMTEHTLIFVMKGVKLLHLQGGTITASPGEVILLRKGIYVMAEYIEAGLNFEAMMIFLPLRLLQSLTHLPAGRLTQTDPYCIFPSTPLIDDFKTSFRNYFSHDHTESLIRLKQQEILLLLISGANRDEVAAFIRSAISSQPQDIDHIVSSYLFQPVTIGELASLANCSLAKFKRDFQQRYKCSPRTWINGKRMEHARMLLHNTDKTISQISFDCGFENISYFIRLYKQIYKETPSKERERAKIAIKRAI